MMKNVKNSSKDSARILGFIRYVFVSSLICFAFLSSIAAQSSLENFKKSFEDQSADPSAQLQIASKAIRQLSAYEDRAFFNKEILRITSENYSKSSLADSTDAIANNEIAWNKLDIAEQFFRQSLKLRNEIGAEVDIAKALFRLAEVLKDQSKYVISLEYLSKSIDLLEKDTISNQRSLGIVYNSIGDVYNKLGEYEYALDYLNKSKNVRAPNSSGLANTLLNLGGLYISMRSYDKSIDFSKQSLKIFEKLDEAEGAAKACNNIGNAYLKKEDLQLAYRYYERALSYEEISPSLRQMIRENIRVIWIEEEKYDKALDAYLDDLRKKELKQENTIISNLNAGILFYRKNEYEQADQYFHDALKGAKSINNKELMSKTMRRMIDNYIFLGNSDSSLAYIDRLAQTEDELKRNFTDAMNMNAYKLRSDNYDTKQRSQQIKITALLMGIIALIGIFISLFAAYREKVKRRDAEKEREQKVKTVLQEVKLKSTEARLEGMLEERKRISDDIHDSVGMMLSSTKLHFESLSKRLDSLEMNQRERFDRAFNMLSLAQKETRRVVHDMANLTLKEHGLKAQIEELVKVIQNTEFNIDLKINGVEDQMDQKIATQVYKIVQELIGNAIKFADASQLDIQIERIENELALQVQDNGKGIAKIEKSTLRSVKGRVKDLGANIKIDSAKGKGTQVLIDQIYLN